MSDWSNPSYGDWVLCASAVLGLVAVGLAWFWDRYNDREWHELRRSKKRKQSK